MIVNRPFGALLVMALLCGCLSAWANGGNPPPLVSVSAGTSHAAFGQTVTLTGDVTDPGDTHTFGWLQLQTTAGPTVVLSNLSGRTTRFTAPNVATFLTFRFTATDSVGQSASADILVQISESGSTGGAGGACGGRPAGSGSGTSSPQRVCPDPVAGGNNPPTATVPATYAIVGGNRASITATRVSDPDGPDVFIPGLNTTGPVIDYRWSVVDGGGFLASSGLTGRLTPTVSFDTPATPTPRTARLSLLVADALGCGSLYILDVVVQPAGKSSQSLARIR